jgi:hypothetical protein
MSDLYIGEKKIAAKAEWTLDLKRDRVDASAFGENKTYMTPSRAISGSFHGVLETWPFEPAESSRELVVYGLMPMPWWRRWAYIVFRRWLAWPLVEVIHGPALIALEDSHAGTIKGTFTADGTWTASVYRHPSFLRWLRAAIVRHRDDIPR